MQHQPYGPKPLSYNEIAMGVFLGLWSFAITAGALTGLVAIVLRMWLHRT